MIKVTGSLQPLLNKVEKIPVEIQSAVAEAMMASEQGIMDVLNSEYQGIFENVQIDVNENPGISIVVDNSDVYYYKNATGSDFDSLVETIKNVVNKNLDESIAKFKGGNFGA
jgi:hypothetical protein